MSIATMKHLKSTATSMRSEIFALIFCKNVPDRRFSLPLRLMRPELITYDRTMKIDGETVSKHWAGKPIELDCPNFGLIFVCELLLLSN